MIRPTIQTVPVSLDTYRRYWHSFREHLNWNCMFMLPPWVEAWWKCFAGAATLHILAVKADSTLIGLAPLKVDGRTAGFIGSADVCDYFDLVLAPGRHPHFWDALINHLQKEGITCLDLTALRPDAAIRQLIGTPLPDREEMMCDMADVSMELTLPESWDAFLEMLSKKERHEIRRKLRRLHEGGDVDIQVVENLSELSEMMDRFLKLFAASREDKQHYMTDTRALFFHRLARKMAEIGSLRLFFLHLSGKPVGTVLCFDYRNRRYLYNNGWDARYSGLGIGQLTKVFSIRDAIDRRLHYYDFLKGGEPYKSRLGGRPVPLHRYQLGL